MIKTWDDLIAAKYGKEKAEEMILFRNLVWKTAGYIPTAIQWEVIRAPRLTKLLSGGVRAGKSITSAMMMAEFAIFEDHEIWLVGETYEAAREEFNYLYNSIARLGLIPDNQVSKPDIGRWKMEVSGGAVIRTKSSGDISKLASVAPIAQLFTEAAQQNPDVFDKALERSLQLDSLVVFSGTLEASKQLEFTNKLTSWKDPQDSRPSTPQSWSMPTWTNTHIFPKGRDDPKFIRMTENMTEEKFNERVAAIPYLPSGLVHKNFGEANIVPLRHDPEIPVHLAIDPGYLSYVVLFLQRFGEYVHVLDEIYCHEAVTDDIVNMTMSHPLWNHVEWGIIDIAARQHTANSGLTVLEKWARMTGLQLVSKKVSVDNGIDAIELRCRPGEDGQPRLLVNASMKFDMDGSGRANSLRAEFLSRRWPRYKANRADGVQPIKANDHALNALGYYLFHFYGQEHQEREQPSDVGKRPALPSRFDRYVPKQQYGIGNRSRYASIFGARRYDQNRRRNKRNR